MTRKFICKFICDFFQLTSKHCNDPISLNSLWGKLGKKQNIIWRKEFVSFTATQLPFITFQQE